MNSAALSTSEIYTENTKGEQIPLFITLGQSKKLLRLFMASAILIFLFSLGLIIWQ